MTCKCCDHNRPLYEAALARISALEAENERLLSLCQTWSESCTGQHGSQMQCVTQASGEVPK
jgi:hypothetical protein